MKESGTNVRKFGIRDKFSYMLGDVGCNLVLTLQTAIFLYFIQRLWVCPEQL